MARIYSETRSGQVMNFLCPHVDHRYKKQPPVKKTDSPLERHRLDKSN